MPKLWTAFRKSWSRPVGIVVVPYGPLPSWRFKFSLSFIVVIAALWTAGTIWAGYIVGRHVDYYATKADNRVLQTKMAYVAKEISQGRKYLALARKTETQMRRTLGMGGAGAVVKEDALGGAKPEDTLSFRKIIEEKAAKISESMFHGGINQMSEESRRALTGFEEIAFYIANQQNIRKATPSIWPAAGRLTSPFGYRLSPFSGDFGDFHAGVDISGIPDSPIYATADGVVRHAGWAAGYGQAVLVDHGFGYSTLYGHTAEIKVHEGDRITRGQAIAGMGTTGRSTGPHVHYEVWLNGKAVNPMKYLKVGETN